MQRLLSRAQFNAVLQAPVLAKTSHFALHVQPLQPSAREHLGLSPHESALGAMVPKRWAKRAVTRNMVKRQIYVLSEQLSCSGTAKAFVVRLRQGFSSGDFSSATSDKLKQSVRQQLQILYAMARKES